MLVAPLQRRHLTPHVVRAKEDALPGLCTEASYGWI
jgi:hypothetical protein